MELSKHAAVRTRQRGFQDGDIVLIRDFGTPVRRPGNAIEYQMRQKDGKRLVQAIHRIMNKAILVNDNEEIILTVYNRDKRH